MAARKPVVEEGQVFPRSSRGGPVADPTAEPQPTEPEAKPKPPKPDKPEKPDKPDKPPKGRK